MNMNNIKTDIIKLTPKDDDILVLKIDVHDTHIVDDPELQESLKH